MYGSSPNGIAFNLGITLPEAERLIKLYFGNFPGIEKYVKNTHAMAIANEYVYGPFNQRKMLYGIKPIFKSTPVYNGALRLSQNVRVQNTSSTFGLVNFTSLNEVIKPFGGRGLCNVYDSFEMEIPIEYAAKAVDLTFLHLEDLPVQNFDWLDLPVTIDVEIGFNWGETEHVKRGTTQEEIEEVLTKLNRERMKK